MINSLKHAGGRLQDMVYTLPAPPVLRILVAFVVRVAQNYIRHDGPHAAAGIAYYALFSLFPVMLAALAIGSLMVGTAEAQERLIAFLDEQVPGLDEEVLRQNLTGVIQARGLVGALSVFTLLWAGRAALIAVRRISNRAWEVTDKPHFLIVQVSNFLGTVGIGALFMVSLFAGTAGRTVQVQTAFIERFIPIDIPLGLMFAIVPFFFSLLVFLVVYRFIPDTKVYWSEALVGAVLAAALFELLKYGFSIYLQEFANFEQVYGNLSTVIVVLLGMFLSSQIFVIGVELSSEYARSSRAGQLKIRGLLKPVRGGLAPEGWQMSLGGAATASGRDGEASEAGSGQRDRPG